MTLESTEGTRLQRKLRGLWLRGHDSRGHWGDTTPRDTEGTWLWGDRTQGDREGTLREHWLRGHDSEGTQRWELWGDWGGTEETLRGLWLRARDSRRIWGDTEGTEGALKGHDSRGHWEDSKGTLRGHYSRGLWGDSEGTLRKHWVDSEGTLRGHWGNTEGILRGHKSRGLWRDSDRGNTTPGGTEGTLRELWGATQEFCTIHILCAFVFLIWMCINCLCLGFLLTDPRFGNEQSWYNRPNSHLSHLWQMFIRVHSPYLINWKR